MTESWHVYIVRCSDDTLFTGITNSLSNRIKTHNEGKGAKYTRGRLPVTLVHKERLTSKSAALKRELQIKKLSRVQKEKLAT